MRELVQYFEEKVDLGEGHGEKSYRWTLTATALNALGEALLDRWLAEEDKDLPNSMSDSLAMSDFGIEDPHDNAGEDRSEGTYSAVIFSHTQAFRTLAEQADEENAGEGEKRKEYETAMESYDSLCADTGVYEGWNTSTAKMGIFVLRHDSTLSAAELLTRVEACPLIAEAAIVDVKLVNEPAPAKAA